MWKHGTCNGYNIHGCRCDLCTSASTDHHRRYIAKRNLKIGKNPPKKRENPRHGTYYMYAKLKCRCNKCRDANNKYGKDLKLRQEAQGGEKFQNAMIATNLRIRLCHAVKRQSKKGSAVRDLGCSIEEFRIHLERGFSDGMSWDNYGKGDGKWNIDHIIPLNTFDLTDREQLLVACHYTNMRPLWQIDNMKRPKDGTDL